MIYLKDYSLLAVAGKNKIISLIDELNGELRV
jgi:hypothetical protein